MMFRSVRLIQHRTNYLVDPASSICLSQRLSHACLSMRGLNTLKLRMAHYISNNFFDGPLATRIPVENLELIRARRPDPREGLQLLDTRPTAFGDPR